MSASKSGLAMIELPGVRESDMPRRSGQRKPGPTRGSPRRSRTAKALRISRYAVKSRCARGWDGWGRLSDDGSRQHNSDKSEDPWGGGTTQPPWRCTIERSARHSAGLPMRPEVHERRTQTAHQPGYAGSRLKPVDVWEGAALKPAFQPYRGKPAVRNDREGRGNVGIIRSPVRASTLPDCSAGFQSGRCPLWVITRIRHFWAYVSFHQLRTCPRI